MMAIRFNGGRDTCLSIFEAVYETGALTFPQHARVLEIGCAEADWMTPMLAVRPDLEITGVDWRACHRPGQVHRADILKLDFPAEHFDAVVGISSIEHIGLGHYEHDPIATDGDTDCLRRVVDWLKPGGWVYADVPYRADGYQVLSTECRVYDDAALDARLLVPGLRDIGRWYASPSGVLCGRDRATAGRFGYVALLAVKG